MALGVAVGIDGEVALGVALSNDGEAALGVAHGIEGAGAAKPHRQKASKSRRFPWN